MHAGFATPPNNKQVRTLLFKLPAKDSEYPVGWLEHFFKVCAVLGGSEFGTVFWNRYTRYLLQPNTECVHVLYTLVP